MSSTVNELSHNLKSILEGPPGWNSIIKNPAYISPELHGKYIKRPNAKPTDLTYMENPNYLPEYIPNPAGQGSNPGIYPRAQGLSLAEAPDLPSTHVGPNLGNYAANWLARQTGSLSPYGYMPSFQQSHEFSKAAALNRFPYNVEAYMNPYQQKVIDRIRDEGMRTFNERILPALSGQFTSLGQHGSSRHQQMAERAAREIQNEILARQAQTLHSGYESAANIFNADMMRNLQASDLLGKLGIAQQQAHHKDVEAHHFSGERERSWEKERLEDDYRRKLMRFEHPYRMLEYYSNMVRGMPHGSITTVPLPPKRGGMRGSDFISSGLGLASMAAPFFMNPAGGFMNPFGRGGNSAAGNLFNKGGLVKPRKYATGGYAHQPNIPQNDFESAQNNVEKFKQMIGMGQVHKGKALGDFLRYMSHLAGANSHNPEVAQYHQGQMGNFQTTFDKNPEVEQNLSILKYLEDQKIAKSEIERKMQELQEHSRHNQAMEGIQSSHYAALAARALQPTREERDELAIANLQKKVLGAVPLSTLSAGARTDAHKELRARSNAATKMYPVISTLDKMVQITKKYPELSTSVAAAMFPSEYKGNVIDTAKLAGMDKNKRVALEKLNKLANDLVIKQVHGLGNQRASIFLEKIMKASNPHYGLTPEAIQSIRDNQKEEYDYTVADSEVAKAALAGGYYLPYMEHSESEVESESPPSGSSINMQKIEEIRNQFPELKNASPEIIWKVINE